MPYTRQIVLSHIHDVCIYSQEHMLLSSHPAHAAASLSYLMLLWYSSSDMGLYIASFCQMSKIEL